MWSRIVQLPPEQISTEYISILTDAVFGGEEDERVAALDRLEAVRESRMCKSFLKHGPPAPRFIPARMVDMLGHPDARARSVAALFLQPDYFPSASSALIRGLVDEDGRVREACITALQEGNLDLTALREYFTSSRADVREAALQVLLRRALHGSRPRRQPFHTEPNTLRADLEPLLKDPAAPVRHLAAVLLENVGALPGGMEVLAEASRSARDERVRHQAMQHVVRQQPASVPSMPEVVRALREQLQQPHPPQKLQQLIGQLGELARRGVDVTDVLVAELRRGSDDAAVSRRDEGLRSHADAVVDALRGYQHAPGIAIPRLLSELEDAQLPDRVRVHVIRALTFFRVTDAPPPEVVDAFVRELGRDSGEGVSAAADALIALPGEKGRLTPRLLALLEDPALPFISRCGVAVVLGYFGEPAAIAPLTLLLEHEDALFPMRTLLRSSPGSCHLEEGWAPWLKLLAIGALARLGRPALGALPVLLESALAYRSLVAEEARSAVRALKPTRSELEAAFPDLKERLLAHLPRHATIAEEDLWMSGELAALIRECSQDGSAPS